MSRLWLSTKEKNTEENKKVKLITNSNNEKMIEEFAEGVHGGKHT